jgi:hypothetical protein
MTTSLRKNRRFYPLVTLGAAAFALFAGLPLSALADPGAGAFCPPFSFVNATNLALNPSFETVGANGNPSTCPAPCTTTPESAAANWTMHSDNFGSAITTRLEPLSVLDPNRVPFGTDPSAGRRMLHVIAGGNEGGVIQRVRRSPAKMMFQVWVYVLKGHVAIQPHGGAGSTVAWSAKKNQWEELRVCTDGTVPTNALLILNQDPAGGNFFIDRAEARAIP